MASGTHVFLFLLLNGGQKLKYAHVIHYITYVFSVLVELTQ